MDKKEVRGFIKASIVWLVLIILVASGVAYTSNVDISDVFGIRFGNVTIANESITAPTVNITTANITSSLIAKMGVFSDYANITSINITGSANHRIYVNNTGYLIIE